MDVTGLFGVMGLVAVIMIGMVGPAFSQNDAKDQTMPYGVMEGFEKYGYDLGTQAYTWFYARWRMILEERDMVYKHKTPINALLKYRTPPTAKDKIYVTPNLDVLNTVAYFDVSVEPQILSIPAMNGDRYYTFMLLDAWHAIIENVSKKNYGLDGVAVAIAGPDWHGALPKDVVEIRSPTNTVAMLGRIRIDPDDPEDIKKAQQLQDQVTSKGLNGYMGKPVPTEKLKSASYDLINPDARKTLAIFDNFEEILRRNPPYDSDAMAAERFREIIPGPGKIIPPPILKGFEKAAADVHRMILWGPSVSRKMGWRQSSTDLSTPTWSWLTRAMITEYGILANVKEESQYITTLADADGKPLVGGKSYMFTFDTPPPVLEFWSVTLYEFPSTFLVNNPQNKYRIGDNTKGLKLEKNGSLKIFISPESPGKEYENNWLPSPGDPSQMLNVAIRLYGTTPTIWNQKWMPQPIQAVK